MPIDLRLNAMTAHHQSSSILEFIPCRLSCIDYLSCERSATRNECMQCLLHNRGETPTYPQPLTCLHSLPASLRPS